jgi:hypothetical protein
MALQEFIYTIRYLVGLQKTTVKALIYNNINAFLFLLAGT